MSAPSEMHDFVNELRDLLKRHEASIIGTVGMHDSVLLEVTAYGKTVIFPEQITSFSKARMILDEY